jgi:hypothetical protein
MRNQFKYKTPSNQIRAILIHAAILSRIVCIRNICIVYDTTTALGITPTSCKYSINEYF